MIAGIAIFGGFGAGDAPDPQQAAMDAAVAEHNARLARALAPIDARMRRRR